MSRDHTSTITPADVVRILREHRRRWIVPMLIFGLLAAAFALLRPATWEASQALMVRDEATGAPVRPGKFQQLDDMKTVQETVLELARSRTVLRAALAEAGPDSRHDANRKWPSDAAISDLKDAMKLAPPKGAEFGKTEVFYLNVEAEAPKRAVALAAAICKQLQSRSQELRDQKAQGLVAELTKTVDLAKADLTTTTHELTAIETRVGSDLGELRGLDDINGGDSPLRRSINEMEQELRQARQAIDANQELFSLLSASKADTSSLLAAPNRLLEAQPVLRRLKDGLVDAQLRTAQLSGNMSDEHPLVIAAKISEQEIGQHVRRDLDSSIRGVQVELRLSQERAAMLDEQLANARNRLANLAAMRAEYGNVVAERNRRVDILKTAEQQLSEARASQAAARTASLIAAIDAPVAGDYPVGPGKAAIVAGGLFGGLLIGLGIVFLTVHPAQGEVNDRAENAAAADELAAAPTVRPVPAMNGHAVNGHANHATNGRAVLPGGLSLKQALGKLAARG